MIPRPLIPLALAGAVCAAGGCGRAAEEEGPRNVVLICVDTLRADHLGYHGYDARPTSPALDALAGRSLRFLDASAQAGWTKPSVPSYLTGTHPLQHGVYDGDSEDVGGRVSDVLPARATTLAEVFADAGYSTAAFVRNAHLRPGLGIEQGFATYVDEAGDAGEIRGRAEEWLAQRSTERPFFLYLHLLDAHWPYPVPEEYATRFAAAEEVAPIRAQDWKELRDAINDGERELTPEELDTLIALYDGAIRYVDEQIGLLLEELERRGLAGDTVVCLISDHGEEFLEHGRIGHGHGLWRNLLHVPWILHVPGGPAGAVGTPVSLVDLFPTLLSAAGVAAPATHEGVDRLAQPQAERPLLAEHKEKRAWRQSLRRGPHKLLRRTVPAAEFLAEAAGASESADGRRSRLLTGRRWEIEMEPDGAGGFRAGELEPSDEPDEDDVEVKGVVTDLSRNSLRLCGVLVVRDAETEIYGETVDAEGAPRELTEGMLVKAKGEFDGDGVLLAEAIKLYAPDAGVDREIRGFIAEVSAGGAHGGAEGGDASSAAGAWRLRVGGLWIAADAATEVDAGDLGPVKPLFTREQIAWAAGQGAEALRARGWEVTDRVYDLREDPGEYAPMNDADAWTRLARELGELARALALKGLFDASDRARLDDADLKALRELGY